MAKIFVLFRGISLSTMHQLLQSLVLQVWPDGSSIKIMGAHFSNEKYDQLKARLNGFDPFTYPNERTNEQSKRQTKSR